MITGTIELDNYRTESKSSVKRSIITISGLQIDKRADRQTDRQTDGWMYLC